MISTTNTRWMGPALFISVALNVFAAGYYLTQSDHHAFGGAGRGGFGSSGGVMRHQLETLNDADRDKAKAIMDQYKPRLKAENQQAHELRGKVDDMLKAPNYSRKSAETLFAQLRDESSKTQALAQQEMLDIADALPADERAKFFTRPQRDESHEGDRAERSDTNDHHAADSENGGRHHRHRAKADDAPPESQDQ